jgi:hypothetical protein
MAALARKIPQTFVRGIVQDSAALSAQLAPRCGNLGQRRKQRLDITTLSLDLFSALDAQYPQNQDHLRGSAIAAFSTLLTIYPCPPQKLGTRSNRRQLSSGFAG